MSEYPRKINKNYQKLFLDIEDGLSTYDLQLLSQANKQKKNKRFFKVKHEDLLAA